MAELSEDIEVITPGQLLKDGREAAGLSKAEVAANLKLREVVIERIENNEFAQEQTQIFMRGYVRTYARLVGVDEETVFAAYDQFDVAQQQYAEMQSFSQRHQKQANDSKLMMFSYVMAFTLIGLSVFWFWQDSQSSDEKVVQTTTESATNETTTPAVEILTADEVVERAETSSQSSRMPIGDASREQDNVPEDVAQIIADDVEAAPVESIVPSVPTEDVSSSTETEEPASSENQQPVATLLMTFTGECWVEVFDATGERLAVGVKQSGKVMPLTGVPPFEIKLGAPEVVNIIYQDNPVDMSIFPEGRVSRFRLPANNG